MPLEGSREVLRCTDAVLLAAVSTLNLRLIPAIASGGSPVLLMWLAAILAFLIP